MSKINIQDLKSLLSSDLPSARKRQLEITIADIEHQQSLLDDRVQAVHKCFSKEIDLSVVPTEPEAIGIAIHKNPDLVLRGTLDINQCYWWTILSLCEKYPQLRPYVSKEMLKTEGETSNILYKHHVRHSFSKNNAKLKVQEHFENIRVKFAKLGITLVKG